MIEATGAQIIIKLLENQGITTVAGIPGGATLPLYDELGKSKIKHILVRHEQAGGFFAQGIARSTGKPGVCLATSGPGAMNLLTALADARADSIPLIAITGQVNTSLIGTDAFQEADTFGLSFPITKHSVMVKGPEELLTAIPRAFKIATSGRPGPVLIDVPRDVQLAIARFEKWPPAGKTCKKAVRFRTEGKDLAERLLKAALLLLEGKKPVLFAGGGCNNFETTKSIGEFLDIIPMPLVTSLMGIGCVRSDHPCNCGMVGMHGSRSANRAMHDADIVIAAGARFDDRATGLISNFCPIAKIIHIDIDAAEVNKILPAAIPFIADTESFFPALNVLLKNEASNRGIDISADSARKDWLDYIRSSAQKDKEKSAHSEKDLSRGTPGRFIASIPSLAKSAGIDPEDIIVVTDVGQHQMWTAQFYPILKPRQFLTSGSLGTMGFGLPAAIGAAWANPGKRIICFTGDGSLMMNIQELASLAELHLDVTLIVLDNGTLGMVYQQQKILCRGNCTASVFSRPPDLLKIAEGFGIPAVDTFTSAWNKHAFPKTGEGPRFVRCVIDPEELVLPFVPGGKANIDAIDS